MANRAEIMSDLVVGEASNGKYHSWNIVTTSDNSTYFYDTTYYNRSRNNKYLHSKTNFHRKYYINDYTHYKEFE